MRSTTVGWLMSVRVVRRSHEPTMPVQLSDARTSKSPPRHDSKTPAKKAAAIRPSPHEGRLARACASFSCGTFVTMAASPQVVNRISSLYIFKKLKIINVSVRYLVRQERGQIHWPLRQSQRS